MKKEQYTILMVDDRLESIGHVKTTLDQIPYVVVETESDITKARSKMDKGGVDILFLDVMMPEVDGFRFLGFLRNMPPTVICSANNTSSYEAFEHGVIDYISKLAPRKRVERALMKAIEMVDKHEENWRRNHTFISLRRVCDNKIVEIDWRNVEYVSIDDNILSVYNMKSESEGYYCSLSAFLNKVPPAEFLKIHRCYAVRTTAIRNRERKKLVLTSWCRLPIGESYSIEVDSVIDCMKYMDSK